jgi:hypothetical protein
MNRITYFCKTCKSVAYYDYKNTYKCKSYCLACRFITGNKRKWFYCRSCGFSRVVGIENKQVRIITNKNELEWIGILYEE